MTNRGLSKECKIVLKLENNQCYSSLFQEMPKMSGVMSQDYIVSLNYIMRPYLKRERGLGVVVYSCCQFEVSLDYKVSSKPGRTA